MISNPNRSGRQAATTFKDRDAWMRAVAADPALTQPTRLIAVRLALHLIVETGRCEPPIETLAHEVCMHRASVYRAIDALAERGWIEVEGTKGRRRNNYRLVTPTVAPVRPFNRRSSATVDISNRRTSATPTVAPVRLEPSHACDPINEEISEEISEEDIYTPEFRLTEVEVERPTPPKPTKQPPNRFEEFYAAFPRHVARGAAVKAYAKALKNGNATEQELIAGAKRYALERAGKPDQYTKHPATWLNAECWKDEPASPVTRSGDHQGILQACSAWYHGEVRQ